MKKIIFLTFALFSAFVTFSQSTFTYNSVNVLFQDMEEPCTQDIQVCLEICWSPSGICTYDAYGVPTSPDLLCNLFGCDNISNNSGKLITSASIIPNICSNKLHITTSTCTFITKNFTEMSVGESFTYNDCECCYKVTYLGNNHPTGYNFIITKC